VIIYSAVFVFIPAKIPISGIGLPLPAIRQTT